MTNNVISGNTVDHFSYSGIVINGDSGQYRTTANEIKNNISFSNGDGIYLHYNDGTKVIGNTLYNNRSEESYGEGYGIGLQTNSNVIIEGNKMYNNRTRGIEIWGGQPTASNPGYGPSLGNQILRNYIYKNSSNGILLSSNGFVKNTIVAYNAIFDNGAEAILISDPNNTGTQIVNNTTYNNTGNTLFYYQTAKPIIKNNLFATGGAVTIYDDSPNGNNGFAGAALRWNGSVIADSQITTKNSSYKVGQADFVRPETGYFYLKTGSPFINAGQTLSYTTDIQKASFSGAPDIGAFEFGVVVPTNTPTPIISGSTTVVSPTLSPTSRPTPSLTKTPPCATRRNGDADCNGVINLIDLEMWSNPYLHSRYDERSDFNYDSRVNLNDLQIWGDHYYTT
jgi:parallel beta-helix repeat protein